MKGALSVVSSLEFPLEGVEHGLLRQKLASNPLDHPDSHLKGHTESGQFIVVTSEGVECGLVG